MTQPAAPAGQAPSAGPPGDPAAGTNPPAPVPVAPSVDELRDRLRAAAEPSGAALALHIVADRHSPEPVVYDLPISASFAAELLAQCQQSALTAAAAELRPAEPGFRPDVHQWVYTPLGDGPLALLEERIRAQRTMPYEGRTEFGRQNLLLLRVIGATGADLLRVYQGFSPEKALHRKKILGFWSGERFDRLTADPLVVDRELRLLVVGGSVVMPTAAAYESLFGALPTLRAQAAETFTATLGRLDIVGGDELLKACTTDLNMMRKLVSIQAKLGQPGYVDSIEMPRLLTFLEHNPQIEVAVDHSGPEPRLVHSSHPQRRWALLKLLDDDYLRSDLTNINYESNSKVEL